MSIHDIKHNALETNVTFIEHQNKSSTGKSYTKHNFVLDEYNFKFQSYIAIMLILWRTIFEVIFL